MANGRKKKKGNKRNTIAAVINLVTLILNLIISILTLIEKIE